MKRLFFFFAFLVCSFLTVAQNDESKVTDLAFTPATLNITIHFKDVADLKRFKTEQLATNDFLKKLEINPSLTFAYTLGEPTRKGLAKKETYDLKVTIKDQPDKPSFMKELSDSIDGVLSLYEKGYLSK
ncbi:MAG: hypothetical protein AAGJ18_22900 [Bacteroidota bacterium]